MLTLPAYREHRDRQVPASAVWGDQVVGWEERLAAADPVGRLALLASIVTAREVVPDTLVYAAACALARPTARVAAVARVVRLRHLIALGDEPLASRAFAAGYASQAHMNDEVRRLTGTTPVRFLKDATLTAS